VFIHAINVQAQQRIASNIKQQVLGSIYSELIKPIIIVNINVSKSEGVAINGLPLYDYVLRHSHLSKKIS